MLLNLKTGRVEGYNEGQAPLIYLTTTVQRVQDAGCQFVFSDGHGLATIHRLVRRLGATRSVGLEPRRSPLLGGPAR